MGISSTLGCGGFPRLFAVRRTYTPLTPGAPANLHLPGQRSLTAATSSRRGAFGDPEPDILENWHRYYNPSVGRYLQPEPMVAVRPAALPAYADALNNPQFYFDPTGFVPGSIFRQGSLSEKRDAAAMDALFFIHPSSEFHQLEYGGMICVREDGGVFATNPVCSESDPHSVETSNAPCPAGTKPIGDYHTHWSNRDEKNKYFPFSLKDISGADSWDLPAYLSRADGTEIWRYYPHPISIRKQIYP